MKNIGLLFEKNNINIQLKHRITNYRLECEIKEKILNGRVIKKIIDYLNSIINQYKNLKIPIVLYLHCKEIEDKLTYVLLECICYYFIYYRKQKIYVIWNPNYNIATEGVEYSVLNYLNNRPEFDRFIKEFDLHIYKNHYRKVVHEDTLTNTAYLGKIDKDIDTFLSGNNVLKIYRDSISDVVTELIGNVCEHSNSDCLVDLDVTNEYWKKDSDEIYYGINVAVVGFSEILLGDKIKKKIFAKINGGERYLKVDAAYNNHKKFFGDDYLEDDFFNITAFQHKISGRYDNKETGGTGLTKLIYSLEEKSDAHNCYVISGNRVLFFHKEYLKYDSEKWIGFNKENDFFNIRPDADILSYCETYIPGTVYNLNFILKKEN